MAYAVEALQAANPARIEHDGANGIAFARVLRTILPVFPRRADVPDEVQRGIELFRQCDGNFALAQRE